MRWLVATAALLGCGRLDFGTGPEHWAVVGTAVTAANLHGLWGDDTDLFAVGDGGTILRSGDRGMTWTASVSPVTGPLYAVTRAGNTVIVTGDVGSASCSCPVQAAPSSTRPTTGAPSTRR